MNCRPGDLAYIVAPYRYLPMRGKPVTVVRRAVEGEFINGWKFIAPPGDDGPAWLCEGSGLSAPNGEPLQQIAIADACLRPIRDPGEDAVDETLAWKPVPQTKPEEIAS